MSKENILTTDEKVEQLKAVRTSRNSDLYDILKSSLAGEAKRVTVDFAFPDGLTQPDLEVNPKSLMKAAADAFSQEDQERPLWENQRISVTTKFHPPETSSHGDFYFAFITDAYIDGDPVYHNDEPARECERVAKIKTELKEGGVGRERLYELLFDDNSDVYEKAMFYGMDNKMFSREDMEKLYEDLKEKKGGELPTWYFVPFLYCNKTPAHILLDGIEKCKDPDITELAARNLNMPIDKLKELAQHKEYHVRDSAMRSLVQIQAFQRDISAPDFAEAYDALKRAVTSIPPGKKERVQSALDNLKASLTESNPYGLFGILDSVENPITVAQRVIGYYESMREKPNIMPENEPGKDQGIEPVPQSKKNRGMDI